MKYSRIISPLLISFALSHCQSPSDQIKDAFKTVDNSLTKSNILINSSIENIYSSIDSVRQKKAGTGPRFQGIHDKIPAQQRALTVDEQLSISTRINDELLGINLIVAIGITNSIACANPRAAGGKHKTDKP